MQDAFSVLPPELFQRIFNLLSFVEQARSSQVNKSWQKAYRSTEILPDAKNILSLMFEPNTPPVKMLRGIESGFSGKIALVRKKQNPDFWDNVICMLITSSLSSIELKQLLEAQKALKIEYKKKCDDTGLLSTSLKQAIFMAQFSKGNRQDKDTNRENFIKWSKDNTIFINFNGGNLSGENLTSANFPGSSFVGTNLIKTNFSKANLIEANLESAKLADINFCGANLMYANLNKVEGIPKFDANTILIGAKMPQWFENKAKASGAILTLKQLAERVKDQPNDFSEFLFLKAFRLLLKQEMVGCPNSEVNQTNGKDLKNAKLEILQDFYNKTKDAMDIQTLRNVMPGIQTQKWRKVITEPNGQKYIEKELSATELLTLRGGIFSNDDLVKSEIIKDLDAALNILKTRDEKNRVSAPSSKVMQNT